MVPLILRNSNRWFISWGLNPSRWLRKSWDLSKIPKHIPYPIGSMYGIYANIWGILMVNVTIYSIHGAYGKGHFHFFGNLRPAEHFEHGHHQNAKLKWNECGWRIFQPLFEFMVVGSSCTGMEHEAKCWAGCVFTPVINGIFLWVLTPRLDLW